MSFTEDPQRLSQHEERLSNISTGCSSNYSKARGKPHVDSKINAMDFSLVGRFIDFGGTRSERNYRRAHTRVYGRHSQTKPPLASRSPKRNPRGLVFSKRAGAGVRAGQRFSFVITRREPLARILSINGFFLLDFP